MVKTIEVAPKKEKKRNPATRTRFLLPTKRVKPEDIDPDVVFKLAETMLPIESIAILLSCGKDMLYDHFGDVLQKARDGRRQTLSMAMWEKALIEKDTKMQIWLSKQHLGFKDVLPEEATQVHFNVYTNEVPK